MTSLFAFFSVTLIALWACLAAGNTDVDALIALKQSLTDPNGVLDSWDPNLVDPCTWFHITCNADNRVTRIDLGLQSLGGVLSPQLGNLDTLQYLELYENNIQGEIPTELGNLASLLSFDLYNNQLSGTLPSSLGKLTQLLFLRVNDNPLMTGIIAPEVANLPNLRIMDTSNTGLRVA